MTPEFSRISHTTLSVLPSKARNLRSLVPPVKTRPLPVVDVGIPVRLGQMHYTVEISIIACLFLTGTDVQGVVKLIHPLCIHPIAGARWVDKTGVVQVVFNDEVVPSARRFRQLIDLLSQFFQYVQRTEILDGMDCVQAQRIDVKIT